MNEAGAANSAHVVIAGGGFAALEAAVGLRVLAGDRVRLTLVAPEPRFAYRPAATAEVFADGEPLAYDLAGLLEGIGAKHQRSRLVAVEPEAKQVRLESGVELAYDALILAIGARSHAAVPGAVTFRDQRDVSRVREVLRELEPRQAPRLVFAVPSRNSWPLPAYELALLAASHFERAGLRVELTLASAERSPLDMFGSRPSRLISELLTRRGIRFLGGVIPHSVTRESLELEFDAPVKADAVIAVPELRGVRISGVPARWFGFIPVNSSGQVEGVDDVYAAGDSTTFPIKQGGLAAQQADQVAHVIATRLGVAVHDSRPRRILQAHLLDGDHRLYLRCELDEFGQPTEPVSERVTRVRPPNGKVFARYLTPYLAVHGPIRTLKAA